MSQDVGIDIGSYAIKLAVGGKKGSGWEINKFVTEFNPAGVVLPADKAGEQRLVEVLKKMAVENKLSGKKVNMALPESAAYTAVVSMPYLSDAELASSINWEAEQHIPVPIADINLEYSVLYKPSKKSLGEKMRVLLVGARKDVVAKCVDMISQAGMELVGLETGMLAVQRALGLQLKQAEAVMVCHIGALATEVLITQNGELVLTYTTQVGGLAFTRSLERGLELQPRQAEEYKRAYGLDPGQLDGKVRQVMLPVVNVLVAELRKAIQFYTASHTSNPIRLMVVSGGSAYLPGLVTFLTESFGTEVVLANPTDGQTVKATGSNPADGAAYAVATGLAMQV